ncbi:hypothetical protein JVU11DRAFT_4550 [Chiua virens]|nr:hypothetical protein JVU11DRAFT_4550 [Chiua virens]
MLSNLFHACMSHVLEPLKTAGEEGVPMTSGDGVIRRVHPVFAVFVGDYPEQVLVCCCKTGDCPKCILKQDEIGESDVPGPLHDLESILSALGKLDTSGPLAFAQACQEAGIKPVIRPFWQDLPYVNIYLSITPDILHQLYQGVMKHLIAWIKTIYGSAQLDARCRRLPPNHGVHLFTNGISKLYRVSGKEHADICRILPGLIFGIPLRNGFLSQRLTRAVRALLNFLYLAQYPMHTSATLALLRDTLKRFHDNKKIFVDLGVRSHLKLPKLHSLNHYVDSIELFGTTDNYDTQYSERLHIDFTKDAYRATNRKDEFPQMMLWLERKEKVQRHEAYIAWILGGRPSPKLTLLAAREGLSVPTGMSTTGSTQEESHFHIAKTPSVRAVSFSSLVADYGATYFRDTLARYIVSHRDPSLSRLEVERQSAKIYFRFSSVQVFHKIKFSIQDPSSPLDSSIPDVAHIKPASKDRRGQIAPGRFDTVLVHHGNHEHTPLIGAHNYQVAQLRAVFQIRKKDMAMLFPATTKQPDYLAYVEWFTPFGQMDPNIRLYHVSRSVRQGRRLASVIDVEKICRSCHLFPNFGPVVPHEWKSSNVLDLAPSFLVNPFVDRNSYMTIV